MAFFDNIENIVRERARRVNPQGGLRFAPTQRRNDAARNRFNVYEQIQDQRRSAEAAQRRREEEEERRRIQEMKRAAAQQQEQQRYKLTAWNDYQRRNFGNRDDREVGREALRNKAGDAYKGQQGYLKFQQEVNDEVAERAGQTARLQLRERFEQDWQREEPIRQWLRTPEAKNVLKGGTQEFNEQDFEPGKLTSALAKNDTFREWEWGRLPEYRARLNEMGVPDFVIDMVQQHLGSEEGQKDYKPIGVRDYQGPVHSIIKEKTGSDFLAGIGANFLFAVPGVGPVLGGAEMGARPGPERGPNLFLEALEVGGSAIVMGRGVNAIEDRIAAQAAQRFGQNIVTQTASRAVARGGMNVTEDAPFIATQLAQAGIDPTSKEGRDIIALQLGVSAFAGSAMPIAGEGLRQGRRGVAQAFQDQVAREAAEIVAAAGAGGAVGEVAGGDFNEWAMRTAALTVAAKLGRSMLDDYEKSGRSISDLFRRPEQPVDMAEAASTGIDYQTRIFTPEDRVWHGSSLDYDMDQALPSANGYIGRGLYAGTDEPAEKIASQYGDLSRELAPTRDLKTLFVDEPVTPDEQAAIRDALPDGVRQAFDEEWGEIDGEVGYSTIRETVIGAFRRPENERTYMEWTNEDFDFAPNSRYDYDGAAADEYVWSEILDTAGFRGKYAKTGNFAAFHDPTMLREVSRKGSAPPSILRRSGGGSADKFDDYDADYARAYRGPQPGVDNAERLMAGSDPVVHRGKQAAIERLQMEARLGRLSPEAAQVHARFIQAIPDKYVDTLATSYRKGIGRGGESAVTEGRYIHMMELLEVVRERVDNGEELSRVLPHELAHHLHRYVPDDLNAALMREWKKELNAEGADVLIEAQPILAKLEEQTLLQRIYNTPGVRSVPTPEERDILNWRPSQEELDLANSTYRYNGGFREWFAEKFADIATRPDAPEYQAPLWKRAIEAVGTFYRAMVDAFRGRDRGIMERTYQGVMEGQFPGERAPWARELDGPTLTDRSTYFNAEDPRFRELQPGERADFLSPREEGMAIAAALEPPAAKEAKAVEAMQEVAKSRPWVRTAPLREQPKDTVSTTPTGVVNPAKQQVANATAETQRYMESAEEQLSKGNRILGRVPQDGKIGAALSPVRWISPAANLSKGQRRVQVAMLAAANYINTAMGSTRAQARQAFDPVLREFMGENPIINAGPLRATGRDLRRAGAQVLSAAAPAAAGYAASEYTDEPMFKEGGMILGALAVGAMSQRQTNRPFDYRIVNRIQFRADISEEAAHVDPRLQSGVGKFYDILQNPWRYELSDSQQSAINTYLETRQRLLLEPTNAELTAAGLDKIPTKENHGILQWFTPESVERAFGKRPQDPFETRTPSFTTPRTPQLERKLGDTYADTLAPRPDAEDGSLIDRDQLELINNPMDLFVEEFKQHAQIRAAAKMTQILKASGEEFVYTKPPKMTKLQRTHHKRQVKTLGQQGWKQIPGITDTWFNPEVIDGVREFLLPPRGREQGFISWLDATTNFVRQSIFTADLSAWTMQGAMAAIEDPVGTVMNAHHLAGATLLGDRYFDWWVTKNRDTWEDFTRSGGIPGYEHEGLEKQLPSLARLPGLRRVESHGFESFLPIHRAIIHKNATDIQRFVDKIMPRQVHTRTGVETLATEVLRDLPLYASLAGVAALSTDGLSDDEKLEAAFMLALGAGGARFASRPLFRRAADAGGPNVRAEVAAAKQTNRIGGTLNRTQLGIKGSQSQIERIFFARSPALTRNTLTLLAKAATDFGPEGAMARGYLVKTGVVMATGLVAMKYAMTGEWDSLDPDDTDSVLHWRNFMKADAGKLGKFTASNGLISLVRALMRQEYKDDEPNTWSRDRWIPLVGIGDWYAGRTPDIVGVFTGGALSSFDEGKISTEDAGLDVVGRRAIPVSIQQAFETGLLQKTALGDYFSPAAETMGLKENEDYNHPGERAAGLLGGFLGLNQQPETISAESTRVRDEMSRDKYPSLRDRNKDGEIGYDDLNIEQKGVVKSALQKKPDYRELNRQLDERNREREEKEGPQAADNVGAYIDSRNQVQANYTERLEKLNEAWLKTQRGEPGGISSQEFKEAFQKLNNERRIALETVDETIGNMKANRPGTDETVLEFLSRDQKREDKAVDDYYRLFDLATDDLGNIDFEKLELLQTQFLEGLSSFDRKYVLDRIQKEPSEFEAVAAYEADKVLMGAYFDLEEPIFQGARRRYGGALARFETANQFDAYVDDFAAEQGVNRREALGLLEDQYYEVRQYLDERREAQQDYRRANPDLENALVSWHGYTRLSDNTFRGRSRRRGGGRNRR